MKLQLVTQNQSGIPNKDHFTSFSVASIEKHIVSSTCPPPMCSNWPKSLLASAFNCSQFHPEVSHHPSPALDPKPLHTQSTKTKTEGQDDNGKKKGGGPTVSDIRKFSCLITLVFWLRLSQGSIASLKAHLYCSHTRHPLH